MPFLFHIFYTVQVHNQTEEKKEIEKVTIIFTVMDQRKRGCKVKYTGLKESRSII